MFKTSLPVDKNISILVVDHLPMVRRMVKNCLRQLGFENVHEAEDGSGAMDKLGSGSFQLIISDSDMPDMSPGELLSHLRSGDSNGTAPVLFIASGTQRSSSRVNHTGDLKTDFIIKPFTAHQIEEKLAKVLV